MSDNSCLVNNCQYFAPKNNNEVKKVNNELTDWEMSRKKIYLKVWSHLEIRIQTIRTDVYSKLIDLLFKFIEDKSHNSNQLNGFLSKSNSGLIPCASISLGMNSNEHKLIYDLLSRKIEDLTTVVVYLNSSQCQNMSSVFDKISDCILNEENSNYFDSHINKSNTNTFARLFKLYDEQVINRDHNNGFCPPIVLFFDEIESFDASVLTSLLMIIKEYIESIPFILVLSASNQSTSLQHLLPATATDCIAIQQLMSISQYQILDRLINDIIADPNIPIKFGPKVLEFIIKIFQSFDCSIQNTQHMIKFLLFQHYYSNPLSVLCQPLRKQKKIIKKLNNKDLELLRTSPLISSFELTLNGNDIKIGLMENIEQLYSSHEQLVFNLKALVILLNRSTIDCIDLKQLYIRTLSQSFDFSQVIDSLNKLSQSQWMTGLEFCLADDSLNGKNFPLIEILTDQTNDLCDLVNQKSSEPQVLDRLHVSEFKDKLSNVRSRAQWKRALNPMKNPKEMTKFEMWKNKTISSIEKVLIEAKNPFSNPLYQILYTDDLDLLKKHIFIVQREDIRETLVKPHQTFAADNGMQIIPDLCLLFSQYQESQAIVNMHDWFTVFKSSIQEQENLGKNKKRSKVDNNEYGIVRFLNTVSDFEFIGLIQPAKRKIDHIIKLIWF